jgi:hypothetical protein
MRPLVPIAVGVGLVAFDFRTESLDLLPDPVGWALVAVGAGMLSLTAAARLAWVTAALSLADAALPFRYIRIDPATGLELTGRQGSDQIRSGVSLQLVFTPVTAWRLVGLTAAVVAGGMALWLLLRGLERRARVDDDTAGADRLRLARWLVTGVWIVPYLLTVAVSLARHPWTYDPVWNGNLEFVGIAAPLVAAALIVLLVTSRGASWAVSPRSVELAPWDEIRWRDGLRRPR